MVKLVCFDLDDTLIRMIHSVMFLCILNGKEREHSMIQKQEEQGFIDYITADYQRAKLIAGLDSSLITKHFSEIINPLHNIEQTVRQLHSSNIRSIIITVGPKQVAGAAKELWGFDAFYGSDYEIINGRFTGKIKEYIDGAGKIKCLQKYLSLHGITPAECIAVGDGSTDIPLFRYCGKSIAINASQDAIKSASYSVSTSNLEDILPFIL